MARRVLVPAYALLAAVAAIASAEWVQPQPVTALAVGAGVVLVSLWLARGRLRGSRRLVLAAAIVAIVVAEPPTAAPVLRRPLPDRRRAPS